MTSDPVLPTLPPDLEAALIRAELRLGPFARRVLWFPVVPSTNDLAAALAERGAEEGCVVLADAQTAGRGRLGRTWASPAEAGLYLSTVLRPRSDVAPLLTIAAGVAFAEGIQAATGLTAALKWPNDIYLGERKVAGILAEAGASATGAHHVVLGCGINVMPALLPLALRPRVTSLEAELGRPVDRGLLLTSSLTSLAARYADLCEGRAAGVLDAWRERARPLLSRRVEWEHEGSPARGVAEDIDAGGALLVRTESGVVRVISGEVKWV
jgi:BirA family biotin operon repressor/biotin-[acetyl-CoA-carboxylase] ligase